METSLKFQILIFLCFSSLASCLQFFPSLNINTPVGFNFEIGSVKHGILNKPLGRSGPVHASSAFALSQCFCFPNNSDGQIVTEHLNLGDQDIERLVVYFYKTNGLLQAFIPNKQKQIMIPDLSFDEIDGDTLKPVLEDLAVDIFENSPSVINKHYQIQSNEEEQTNSDTVDIEPDEDINDAIVPPSDKEQETIDSEMEDRPDEETHSTLPPSYDNSLLDEHNMPVYEHDISTEKHTPASDDPTDLVIDSPQLPAENFLMNNANLENINSFDQLQKILSMLPQDSRLYLQSLFPQLLYLKAESHKGNKDITFDDWFKSQLAGIMLHNLPTAADIEELKQRIIGVLESNGMRLSSDDKLFDSNGNLLIISNIKLRPILIGEPIETQIKVNHESSIKYVTSTEMSYFQVILITLVNPPSLLGVVPVGKVNIPRGINRESKITLLNNKDETESRSGLLFSGVGCKTCNRHGLNKIRYSPLNGIPYFQLPLRKLSRNQVYLSRRKLSKGLQDTHLQTQNILDNKVNKGSYENIIPKLQHLFGKSNISGDQSLRILGGKFLQTHKPVSHAYPNDDLPGFRIIGGKPAISSGTPLVSKGRSGFKRPF